MDNMQYAIINAGTIDNVIETPEGWTVPAGMDVVRVDTLSPVPWIGWGYGGGTFTPPGAPSRTLAQQGAALIAAGLTITSTGTPALNGVYAVADSVPFGRQDIANEAQFVSTFGEFTNGGTTLAWPLLSGAMVTFPSTAEFMAFAKAVAQFRAAILAAMATNGLLPSGTATIA